MTTNSPIISSLLNGKPADCINLQDRGLQYGDGLFETIRVADGKLQFWQAHMLRLQRGCAALKLICPDFDVLQMEANRLCQNDASGTLKIVITRGIGQRGYRAVDTQPSRIVSFYPRQQPLKGEPRVIRLRLCEQHLGINPSLAGIKHLNRLEQVLARAEWEDDFDEGVMLDVEGKVIEGTMSNLFLVKDGELITPELTRCGVAGIMRDQIIQKASTLKIPTHIRDVQPAELSQADEIFMSNCVIGIWPVGTFEGHSMATGTVTDSLIQALGLPC